jgi:hypothetical protein
VRGDMSPSEARTSDFISRRLGVSKATAKSGDGLRFIDFLPV